MRIPLAISLVSLSAVTRAFAPHRVQQHPLSIKPVFSSTTIVNPPLKTSHNNVNYSKTARKAEVAYPVDGSECSDEMQIRMTRHLCARLTS